MDTALWAALGASLVIHGIMGAALYAARHRPKKTKAFDLTAQDLLHDLTQRGQAILRVEVIDPSALLLRSPR